MNRKILLIFTFVFIFFQHSQISFANADEDMKIMSRLNSDVTISDEEMSQYYNHAMNNFKAAKEIKDRCEGPYGWRCGQEEYYGNEGFVDGGYEIMKALCERNYGPACRSIGH